ncbi:MAG: histidine phosphatase family protein [Lachnospiraceae bacterium]|nr:histidine phosphatase family protein [Lachnospiraceae bacterium]
MRNRTDHQVTLVFIRHGATKANKEHRYLGRTDEGLSEEGIGELLSYQRQSSYPNVDCLFTSPMKRCLETARILYPNLHPAVIPEWAETDFGQFEYKSYEELKGDPLYQAWIDSGGALPFPGGESREEFIARCNKGFLKMCDELRREESATAGIIVHGGTIMALLSKYCGGDYYDYQVGNGGGYICRMKGWGEGTICDTTLLHFLPDSC